MSRTKQSQRKGGGKNNDSTSAFVAFLTTHLLNAATEQYQRSLTPEEVAKETKIAEELFNEKKAEENARANITSYLHAYCDVQAKKGASRLVLVKPQGAHKQFSFSVTTAAGEKVEATGTTKIEAAEALLRLLFPNMNTILEITQHINQIQRQAKEERKTANELKRIRGNDNVNKEDNNSEATKVKKSKNQNLADEGEEELIDV